MITILTLAREPDKWTALWKGDEPLGISRTVSGSEPLLPTYGSIPVRFRTILRRRPRTSRTATSAKRSGSVRTLQRQLMGTVSPGNMQLLMDTCICYCPCVGLFSLIATKSHRAEIKPMGNHHPVRSARIKPQQSENDCCQKPQKLPGRR